MQEITTNLKTATKIFLFGPLSTLHLAIIMALVYARMYNQEVNYFPIEVPRIQPYVYFI